VAPTRGAGAVVDRPPSDRATARPSGADRVGIAPWDAHPNAIVLLGAIVVPIVLGEAVARAPNPDAVALAGIAGIVGLVAALVSPRWALVGSVFLLVAYLPDVVGGGAHKSASAALPVLIVIAVVVRHVTGVERFAIRGDVTWFAFFGVALLVTTATAGERLLSELGDFVGFALLAGVMLTIIDSRTWLRRVMWAIVAAGALLATLSIEQQLTHSYGRTFGGLAVITPDQIGMRSGGPLSPDYFAQVLVSTAALAASLAFAARTTRERMLAVLAVVVCLAATFATQSRGALVAVLVATIAFLILRGVQPSKVAAAGAAVALVALVALPAGVQHRIGDLSTLRSGGATSDSSLRGRVAENLTAVQMFRDHPLLGVGPDNFERHYLAYEEHIGLDARAEVRGAHSLYLESLAELGLVGSVPFFALLGTGLRRAAQGRKQPGAPVDLLAEGCLVAWLAFLVSAAALHLSYPRYLWIFLALAFTAGQARLIREPRPA